MLLEQKIGIIGGGQLGKMMVLSAKNMGFKVIILDPSIDCPAHSIADEHIVANFDDATAIQDLVKRSSVTTYEFEHIGVDTLLQLEEEGHFIFPSPKHLQIIQNKYIQKKFLHSHNIPVPTMKKIENIDEALTLAASWQYPVMVKKAIGGYDGKGNLVYKNEQTLKKELPILLTESADVFMEEWIHYQMEISVLACRGKTGEIKVYPPVINTHYNSILDETLYPANLSKETEEKALAIAKEIMECFAGVGLFCMELFVLNDGTILVNEIAPRTHNSGHYTIEACITSQFEQHVRAITGLPLGSTKMKVDYAVMKNLIGPIDVTPGKVRYLGVEQALAIEDVHLHIYGKKAIQPKRKMGHITVCGTNKDEVLKKVRKAHDVLSLHTQEGD